MTDIDPSFLSDMLRDSLAKGQHPRLTVSSNSMAPLLKRGDQIILAAIQPEQLKPGDIITLIDSGSAQSLLTHRIWAIQGNVILTRGDHALVLDTPWPANAVLGRVTGRTRQQHTLSFQVGLGRWLDRRLAALAQQEQRWLTGSQEAPVSNGVEPIALRRGTRLVHYLFYGWAIFLTTAVNLAAGFTSGENGI